jgi:uncharacterized protein DUF3106
MIWRFSTTSRRIRNRLAVVQGLLARGKRGEEARKVNPAKHISRWVMAATFALAAVSVPCAAQRPRNAPPPPPRRQQPRPQKESRQQGHAGDWLRRYKDVPPNEQERALQNDPQFRHLPPERQQELRQRLQRFSNLPPEQQQRVLNRMETWEHLTPEQKQQAREIFGQMQQLPPDRRRMVHSAIGDLRAMPSEQREQVINSERFKSMFSPQEREMLRGASRLPLAPPEGAEQSAPQE